MKGIEMMNGKNTFNAKKLTRSGGVFVNYN